VMPLEELETWLEFLKGHHGRDYCHLHDPLAVAFAVEPRIVTQTVRVGIRVECQGEFTIGATVPFRGEASSNVEVVTQVDLSLFYEIFMSRIQRVRRVEKTLN
jgi:inosine-uridine nucleoside N-ribohydrolase